MSACAITLVFAVTTRASTTTPLPSWPKSSSGGTRRKTATIGSRKKASVSASASTSAASKSELLPKTAGRRTLLLRRRDPEAGRDQLRPAGGAEHLVNERLRVGLARAGGNDADAVAHRRL